MYTIYMQNRNEGNPKMEMIRRIYTLDPVTVKLLDKMVQRHGDRFANRSYVVRLAVQRLAEEENITVDQESERVPA